MFGDFIPNDYFAKKHQNFNIVTGCNMSGKSTYIRAVALLQIMAQIGSFVPAEYASFPAMQNIFARLSLDDCLQANLSTFAMEMREMAFIQRNVDENSIVIIDELGRGTGTRDGLSIAIAMSEALIQTNALVWFATHFADLARVLGDRPGVLNLHLQSTCSVSEDGKPQLHMLHKVGKSALEGELHYGIQLARSMGLPPAFIDRAEEISREIRRKREANWQTRASQSVIARRKLVLNLYDALQQAMEVGTDEALPGYLRRLQEQFVQRMEEVSNV